MSFETTVIFSLSIGIGVIIGWARFYKTDPAFLPFLLLLTLGFINEITSFILARRGITNFHNYNVFKLIESILLTWQFLKWGLFLKGRYLYFSVQFIFFAGWVMETFLLSSSHTFNSYYTIGHSFVLVVMSINMLNIIVFNSHKSILKQPVFLICTGLIMYFTYAILVETFWIFGLNKSRLFRVKIFEIMAYINLTCNLIFAYSFLWIPMRPRYIMR